MRTVKGEQEVVEVGGLSEVNGWCGEHGELKLWVRLHFLTTGMQI